MAVFGRLLLAGLLLLASAPVQAQVRGAGAAPDEAIPVRCVNPAGTAFESCAGSGGTGGGTTDTDDGSIAGGQTVGLVQAQNGVWDGSVWRRLQFGQAAKASSLSVTIASDQDALHTICDSGCGSAASVLMADATANPTIPQAASFGMLFNGTTWDRWRGDTTSGAWVNVKNSSLAVTQSGSWTGVGVTGTFWPTTAGAPSSTRLSDGAAFYDARSIRALTSSDVVTVNNSFLLDATFTGRMPAGASPANGESNTNTSLSRIGSYNYIFNGSTWDRWTGAVSGTVTANQGTANTRANRWFVGVSDGTNDMPTMDAAARAGFQKVTDGTNTASVLAASTAAQATDKPIVVALHPSSPLPGGTGNLGTVKVWDGTNTATVRAGSSLPVPGDTGFVVDIRPGGVFAAQLTGQDGFTNPTTTIVHVSETRFNGVTWDRLHNNWRTTTGDTGTHTTTFNGVSQTNYDARGAYILVQLGTVSGTSPTLACQLQWSFDAGTTWLNLGSAMANLTASNQTGAIVIYPTTLGNLTQASPQVTNGLTTGATQTVAINAPLPRTWRVAYTIGGTTPSFAFTGVHVLYIQ